MISRIKKSVNNIISGVWEQLTTLILAFITRTVFIKTLEANYLGINGLFSNIINILSITELGFGTAIIYSMYKPIAEGNHKQLAALMNYYKKIYNILAAVVFLLGIAIIPFLKYMVKTDIKIDNVLIYYLMFLANSVCSYLLANRIAIIKANQNAHIVSRYNIFFTILKNVLQIISLIIFNNFLIYLAIQIITTFLTNVYGAIVAKRMYPYAFEKETLEKKEKKKLRDNVKSMAIYKFGGTVMNQTDNILMSMICGTINVGIYSNYYLIIGTLNSFTNIIFSAIIASVGNLNASNEKQKKINMFYNINCFSNWMYGFCAVALLVLFNPFIKIWIGAEYAFSDLIVFCIVLNFYILGMLNVILVYRNTTGLFRQTKYIFLIAAILNLVLSVILGKLCGVFGILIATSISTILTNFWFEPYKLFKEYFKQSPAKYFIDRVKNVILISISVIILKIMFYIIEMFNIGNIVNFIIQIILTVIIPNLIFYLFYRRKEEVEYFKMIANKFFEKMKGKLKI